MLDRVRRRAWGLSGRLIASYILVTLAVVVLVEALVLGFQVPPLVNGAQLQAQVDATAKSYAQQLAQRYPGGVPAGTLLGDPASRRGRAWPGRPGRHAGSFRRSPARSAATRRSPRSWRSPPTARSSRPPRRPGTRPDGRRPANSPPRRPRRSQPATHMSSNAAACPRRTAACSGWSGRGPRRLSSRRQRAGTVAYVYVQAPWSPGFINPIRAWSELRQLGEDGPLLSGPFALLIAIVPVGVLFGLLASRRLVRRVRRLERATLAVADGDYTVTLPVSGRDEIGRLEANFTTMTRQLGSALAAERQRATGDARAAERARIAREVHDAISQHLFGLRMIAAGMRRADPGNQQARAIERISEEALRDMQALLIELRPASLDGAGLAPALQEICAAYHDRLGVTVDASLDDVTVPAPVEHALLRITQEACANAVRHGNARRLAVSMTRQDGHVQLAVRDTGTGFDPAAPHAGSGLAHIRDRVAELGGTVDIDSAPGRGAALTVRVPVP